MDEWKEAEFMSQSSARELIRKKESNRSGRSGSRGPPQRRGNSTRRRRDDEESVELESSATVEEEIQKEAKEVKEVRASSQEDVNTSKLCCKAISKIADLCAGASGDKTPETRVAIEKILSILRELG